MRPLPLLASIALAGVLLPATGCFNEAFQTNEGLESPSRFELLIEPDRTLVDGTHFLVDRATGDLWRLDVRERSEGRWVRLADGPSDVAALPQPSDAEPEAD
ncbi:MAG: hypothetical protein HKP30_06505 [Myxococcales bacterium]|nr:hypothetical protein [Myxococcales bacterium]